ncbi:hypothetical protein [Chryseobacterium sp. MFBS3-17]|uniref:hypothetical protein n=1 Tax=Chryseobacterium sp. MFBS3-17 TaxID=2886689 RepID=UPI001D0ECFFD|nr:hypothetical protein [Chryseobacterium sp. MFBS3-17]MCC2590401.1 hypothetical protein [Chryseobacterium sp. MFBS3-17]
MPTVPSNALATSSDSTGRNVRAEWAAESFFLLEKDKTFSQSINDKFGIKGTGASSTFRTTSKITYTGKVFTICQAQLFVQPNSGDPAKVNVILKPFSQPMKGLAIKYIIYRGLLKNDFFDNNHQVLQSSGSSTDFITRIREDFAKFYGANGVNTTPPPFLAEYIGYPAFNPQPGQAQNDTDLIDDYFFKKSWEEDANGQITQPEKQAYELPIIPQGVYLGNTSGELGIDIVLNEGDFSIENDPNPFQLNLQYARAADFELIPTGNDFQKKLIRESATQFMDIAAFYGMHAQGKGKLKVNTQTNALQTVDEIYGAIQSFQTAQTSYLYIQSNRQRSYNFYGNYAESATNDNNIKIGNDINNLLETQFEENWPIWELNNLPQLVVQLTTDNNDAAALYVKQGILSENTVHEDYFIRNENLLQQAGTNINTNYTKPFTFNFLKTANNESLACIVQLVYEGKLISVADQVPTGDPNNPTQTVYRYMKDIDDIFGLINAEPHIKSPTDSELYYIVDQNLLLINFENKTGGQDIATVTTKRTQDEVLKDDDQTLSRITFETLLNDIRQNTGSFFQSLSAYKDNSNSGVMAFSKQLNNFYQPESPYYLQTEVFTGADGITITGLSLHSSDGAIPSKKLLGITKEENDQLKGLITQHNLNNPKVYFKNDLEDEESYYTSSEGTEYRKYSICILGENQNGALEFYEPATKIYVTTIDNRTYATETYSKWVPKIERTQMIISSFFI